jgi:hypothetical protein
MLLPFIRHCHARVAFLLVLQAGKSGLTLLLPQSLASKPGVEASRAKPQEDDSGCRLEAVALVLPQFVDRPLSILVGTFREGASPKKNGPPGWVRRQYPSSLFVFAKGLLMSFFVMKGTTNIGRGIEFLIIIEHPGGGAWGRL